MRKHISFTKKLSKLILSINVSIESYFNKLKVFLTSITKKEFITNNKVILSLGALVILTFSYFLIPTIYDKEKLGKVIKNQIFNKYNINVNLIEKLDYSLLPKPHFITKNSIIERNGKKIGETKTFRIFISINNLFSFDNFEIKDLVLEKTDFNLNIESIFFFKDLFNIEPSKNKIVLKNSNLFFNDKKGEVLFINRIFESKFYYDLNNLENVLWSKNKVFNIPYKLIIKDNKFKKKTFTEINSRKLRLNVQNKIDYKEIEKSGFLEALFVNKSTDLSYKINKNSLSFVSQNTKNNYKGIIDFKPFYFSTDLYYQGLNFKNILKPDSILVDLINSEILKNKNLNANITLDVNDITNISELNNLYLKFSIQEGDITLSDSNVMWRDDVKITISESLLSYGENEIYLTGKIDFDFKDLENFYKSFQIKKKHRKKLKKIQVDFMYDLNQQKINIDNIKIDNTNNLKIEKHIEKFNKAGGKIFNKITFKNFINNFFSIYAG